MKVPPPLVYYPSEALRRPARAVAHPALGTHSLETQAAAMLQACEAHRGLGLAAQQVGLDLALAVIPLLRGQEAHRLYAVANLEVLERGPEVFGEEGCLSLYSVLAQARAPSWVRCRGIDVLTGAPFEETVRGYAARAVVHEADHLVGRLLLDRLNAPWKKLFLRQVEKARVKMALSMAGQVPAPKGVGDAELRPPVHDRASR
jgi:peptide deformylase